jgi:hypothetical protein
LLFLLFFAANYQPLATVLEADLDLLDRIGRADRFHRSNPNAAARQRLEFAPRH